MKKYIIAVFCLFLLLSCTDNNNKAGSVISIKKEVMDIAIKYASDKFKESKRTVGADGTVTITDNQVTYVFTGDNEIKYVINPAKIFIGLIDGNTDDDAIITISSFKGQYQEMDENLIMIKTDGKLMLTGVIESDMKILGIKDRVITAEVLTRSRNSPLRDCSACKEVVKYQFKMGDLVRIE